MAKELERAEVEQWLNAQIGSKAIQNIKLTGSGVTISNISGCQMYIQMDNRALRKVAEILGLTMRHEDREFEVYKHEISFIYNGMEFTALESDADYEKYGAVE